MAEAETGPPPPGEPGGPDPHRNRRQVLYWRLLARLSGAEEQPALESAGVAAAEAAGLPPAVMDPGVSVDSLVQRFPELAAELQGLSEVAGAGAEGASALGAPVGDQEVRRAALMSKLLLNVFSTGSGDVTAEQLSSWQSDAGWLEQAYGHAPGSMRGRPRAGGLAGTLGELEGDLVRRMRLREVLADDALASRLTPSMSLIEQLLRDKSNLSGTALANAKALIRRYVDEVAEVLRTQVAQASAGTVDRSVPPKRVFRNLDLQRTIWKNLPNWSPDDQRLYVDRLYYRHTSKRIEPARLIVVVDQSGSMVDSMVNCTILASIFAGLPKVDVHLVAYDTRALDLTPWVHDPFETLLRTQLGGGTDGTAALEHVRPKIADPRNTVVVWISDFYEWNERTVFGGMESLHRSGVRFIPVGSVTSGGRQSVNPWFRQRFKDMGTPVLSGHVKKLVHELKNFLG
ncbi:VWA domain-containing protein [Nocardiopsis sp. RSe5-2]|uniref:VWA domain-containing protein n=1 Tax=Nocardiopsis endophytica TaxID=3018445 RepID=A0ABT4U7J6_9ACTN|nr:VWA domain-containing protein [Nocardiopsis endophytica]MDA2812375.1 VWA domain-containing protein [Nocardiopsis endophytica]